MPFAIRRFREDDTLGLMTLFYETIHSVNTRDYTPEQVHAWAPHPPDEMDHATWAANLGDRYTVVAEGSGGVLIGFANLEPVEGAEGEGYIDRFFGHRDYQGIGVGAALLAALEQEARRRGMTRLRTHASITARPFFARHGFQVLAEQTVERFGVRLTNFRMEKALTDSVLSNRDTRNPEMPTDTSESSDSNRRMTMTRLSLADLPPRSPLPLGITIRPMTGAGEASRWTDIQRDAEPFFSIADDLFTREFGTEDAAIAARCLLAVEDATGEAIGTASAWHGADPGARGADWGRLHWVATKPGFQRRGIARALVVECLHRLAALGHERAYLVTSSGRSGAIALYESLGFTIDTDDDSNTSR